MSAVRDRQAGAEAPTFDQPLAMTFGWGDFTLSEVVYWQEEGDHIFRSTEYDVMASDADPLEAARLFVHNTIAYAQLLSEADDRTADDVDTANMIMRRVVAIFDEMQRQAERESPILRRVRHGRRARRRGARWQAHPVAQS